MIPPAYQLPQPSPHFRPMTTFNGKIFVQINRKCRCCGNLLWREKGTYANNGWCDLPRCQAHRKEHFNFPRKDMDSVERQMARKIDKVIVREKRGRCRGIPHPETGKIMHAAECNGVIPKICGNRFFSPQCHKMATRIQGGDDYNA